nr:tryptophan aminotransferase-related protein 3-like [Tanacetum cinerariifolium]
MATTSKIDSTHKDKGNKIIAEPEIIATSDLRPIHCNKTIEAVIYRKWTSKHVHTQTNKVLLHLNGQADYVGRIQAVSRIYTSRDVTTYQTRQRIIDIQNLWIFNCDVQMFDHQTMFYNGKTFNFEGDTKRWKSNNDTDGNDVIELLTSTNNPDGAIYDHAYYGPQVLVKIGIVAVKISTGNVDGVFRDGLLRNGLQAKIVSLSLAELLLGGLLSKLTKRRAPSTRKTLFKDDPEVDPSELTKKMKHDK